jgi:hypothetical protein
MAIAQPSPKALQPTEIRPVHSTPPENGTRSVHDDGLEYIFYDDCWVRYYEPIDESLASRKTLIDNLTRRAFHHTEPGINTPGHRLDEARIAYESQQDPAMKRVNAAMLAGALFNRATDIFTAIVELEEKGVKLSRDNELMRACGTCFEEALMLGKEVKHHSGEEGIDELWGEPFRAFTIPITTYYESRFIKVAQTMCNIDLLASTIKSTFCNRPEFEGLAVLVDTYADASKHECETMKSDTTIFDIWPRFIATGEELGDFKPTLQAGCSQECEYAIEHAMQTLIAGRNLINWVARARVPMKKSTENYVQRCHALQDRLAVCK